MSDEKVHAFERAGLGRAPFRLVGVERRVGPLHLGGGSYAGAPGQPMGSCQFCGMGIAECCIVRDADGKTFVVGNVCVNKTGDAGLRKNVAAAVRDHRREQRHKREDEKIAAVAERLKESDLRKSLQAMPHPNEWMATSKKLTRLDWAEWIISHAGRAGRIDLGRYLEQLSPSEED